MSRRQDRATLLIKKDASFRNKLDLPLNILKVKGEEILRQGGITDWEEELNHLRNQLTPEQPGTCDGYDMRQRKRDNMKLMEEQNQQEEIQRQAEEEEEQELRKKERYRRFVEEGGDEDNVEDNDHDVGLDSRCQGSFRQGQNCSCCISLSG